MYLNFLHYVFIFYYYLYDKFEDVMIIEFKKSIKVIENNLFTKIYL